ncbi:hypothetical protein BDF21DRAFT_395180 [Thamnidium elegans]|uniref:Uncharacterized protein n=1 Tax=Thamnidium elegans TaxID=101142 RepID=A0A8H7SLW8_9FUNG|nr:hypothetical protein INT48_006903 [Thamnidium elegans]KAI8094771.1 hypothetical protein BDF21DRAFT_395180 [Thamnidium elegans]
MSATVNINSRPQSFVYPHFHDTQSTRRTNKESEIDKSVYHLLSLYLNADSLDKMNPTNTLLSKPIKHTSPYWRTKSNRNTISKRNWLGEEENYKDQQELLLERNTIKNSTTTLVYDENVMKTTKKKSVSFNETVTVISQDVKSCSRLKHADLLESNTEEEDELIFVDALEFI